MKDSNCVKFRVLILDISPKCILSENKILLIIHGNNTISIGEIVDDIDGQKNFKGNIIYRNRSYKKLGKDIKKY